MKRFYYLSLLWLVPLSAAFAQRLTMHDLIEIACMKAVQFDSCLFRKGFTLAKRSESPVNSAYVYVYQQDTYFSDLTNASALIETICNGQFGIVVFQQCSINHFRALRRELVQLGFQAAPEADSELTRRQIYFRDNLVVSFKPVDRSNGIAGNYRGYSVSIHHSRSLPF